MCKEHINKLLETNKKALNKCWYHLDKYPFDDKINSRKALLLAERKKMFEMLDIINATEERIRLHNEEYMKLIKER